MITYQHFSPTTIHVLKDGKVIGSLRRGRTPQITWFFEHPSSRPLSDTDRHTVLIASCRLYNVYSNPQVAEALNTP